jgi:hypothetical protein
MCIPGTRKWMTYFPSKQISSDDSSISLSLSILLFIESWLKKGFEDPNLSCSSKIKEFILAIPGSESDMMEAKAAEIARLVEDAEYVGGGGLLTTVIS